MVNIPSLRSAVQIFNIRVNLLLYNLKIITSFDIICVILLVFLRYFNEYVCKILTFKNAQYINLHLSWLHKIGNAERTQMLLCYALDGNSTWADYDDFLNC